MPRTNQLEEYRKNAIAGASPLQLVIMLYDGAMRFIEQGKAAMERRDLHAQNTALQRAQAIVTELTSCLDMKAGGEIAKNLFALYTYVYNQLVQANVEDRPELLDPCLKILSSLRESWAILEERQRSPAEAQSEAA